MNRKSFLKRIGLSAAAAIMGPSILVANTKTNEEVLQESAFDSENIIEELGNGWEIDDSLESNAWAFSAWGDHVETIQIGSNSTIDLMTLKKKKGKNTEGQHLGIHNTMDITAIKRANGTTRVIKGNKIKLNKRLDY